MDPEVSAAIKRISSPFDYRNKQSNKFQLLVSTIDFRYITDVVTPAEAVAFLRENAAGKEKREKELREIGYPCYTTQVGKIVKFVFLKKLNRI